jgi:transposase InsO family protein
MNNQNKFMLTIIDEYSRFPFAFPCKDVSTFESIIHCLSQLFSIFGMPAYIHSDRGSGFMSAKLQKGISSSRTTPYNRGGNVQVERCEWYLVEGSFSLAKDPRTSYQLLARCFE